MKAKNPIDGKWYYFVDKCLPFGAAISCSIFQEFSDALSFIIRKRNEEENINYLDDFFFAALLKKFCDEYVQNFLDLCQQINFPVSLEKTEWGTTVIAFLGLLIDTKKQLVCVPVDKVQNCLEMVRK